MTLADNSQHGTPRVRVVGLGGSLRANSTSRAALGIALEGAAGAGALAELLDVRELDLPFYDPDSDHVPAAAQRLADAVYEADGMLWSSPHYHAAMSGSFKNALDWLQLLSQRDPPFLSDKVIGLISVAAGTQGLQVVNGMEFVVRALRAWAVPLVVPIPQSYQAFDQDGRSTDLKVDELLKQLGEEVVRISRLVTGKRTVDPAAECAAAAARLVKVPLVSSGIE